MTTVSPWAKGSFKKQSFYVRDYPTISITVTQYTQKRVNRKKKYTTAQRKNKYQTNIIL